MTEKDLYAALGVARTASDAEIKKSYRKLARKYHPDVNPGNKAAEERFKEISEAHDILSEPQKRKLYDEFGMAGVQSGFDPEQARAYRDFAQGRRTGGGEGGGGTWETWTTSGDPRSGFAGYSNFEDLFGDIFADRAAREQPMRGGDAET